MKASWLLTFFVSLLPTHASDGSDRDIYARTGWSLSTINHVFKEVSLGYVDVIDPETLAHAAIRGMLSGLDPYTQYLNGNEADEFDRMNTGFYAGFGFSLDIVDSMLTIVRVNDGAPASRSGLRIGDVLYRVDSVITYHHSVDSVRRYLKGAAGTAAAVWVVRPPSNDTLVFNITRENIPLETIAYSTVFPDAIAYIRLERFNRRTAEDLRGAIKSLRESRNLKGLILDLRDNPGGLLEAAVGVCRIFVPEGSIIVSTQGRDGQGGRVYTSEGPPLEGNLPLAILINSASASASEVVAGAIQDLDRGVVLGQASYGKGLVQSIVSLADDAVLKITTARYYAPSGRSIQKLAYAPGTKPIRLNEAKAEGTKSYFSKGGRLVSESCGIVPDIFVADTVSSKILRSILKSSLPFHFANAYVNDRMQLDGNIQVGTEREMLASFIRYIETTPLRYRLSLFHGLEQLKSTGAIVADSPIGKRMLDQLEKVIAKGISREMQTQATVLQRHLAYEVLLRTEGNPAALTYGIPSDKIINRARDILVSAEYSTVLDAGKAIDH